MCQKKCKKFRTKFWFLFLFHHIFQATLHIVPSFNDYNWPKSYTMQNSFNDVQQLNASMAIQLSWNWLRHNSKLIKNQHLIELLNDRNASKLIVNLTTEFIAGLNNFSWPGRFQILHRRHQNQRFFIDGAHTIESLKLCLGWFKLKTMDRLAKAVKISVAN